MTDAEILAGLKKADRLLAKYVKLAEPLAKELARKKSLFVFKKPGGYKGHLGCFEAGADTLCLHIENAEEFLGKTYSQYKKRAENRAYSFEHKWVRRVINHGIKNLGISGHF